MKSRSLALAVMLSLALTGCATPENVAPAADPAPGAAEPDAGTPRGSGPESEGPAASDEAHLNRTARFPVQWLAHVNACGSLGCDVVVGHPDGAGEQRPRTFFVDVPANDSALVTVTLWLNASAGHTPGWRLVVQQLDANDRATVRGEGAGTSPVTVALELEAGRYRLGWAAEDTSAGAEGTGAVLVTGPVIAA